MSARSEVVALWARREGRRRWLSLVVLGLLAGVSAGVAIAAIAGARRTSTAYERMHASQLGADVVFFPSQVRIDNADITQLSKLPEVESVAGFALGPSAFDGFPTGEGPFWAVGPDWFTRIERPTVLAGRLPDPNRDDEAVITAAAQSQGLHLGQHLTSRTLAPDEGSDARGSVVDFSTSHGPVTELTIVGVVRLPMESVLAFASEGLVITSPGWAAQHLENAAHFTNALVRLRDGAADAPRFAADVATLSGRSDIPIKNLADDVKRVENATNLERSGLLLFAAAIILAGLVLAGQALARSVRAGAEALPALRGLGVDVPTLAIGLAAPFAITVVTAGASAFATAVAFSPRFPIGLARRLDPAVGFHVDPLVVSFGVAATVLVVAATVAGVALLVARRAAVPTRARRMRWLGSANRAGLPIPLGVGTSLALDNPGGSATATSRSASFGAVAGVLGILAAATLVAGIDDALHSPERVGTVWDLELQASDESALPTILADPQAAAVGLLARFPTTIGGSESPIYTLDVRKGSLTPVTLSGRVFANDTEMVLAPETAKRIHAHRGDVIAIGDHGDRLTVVGIGLVPQTPHTNFDEGAWVTPTTFDHVSGLPRDQVKETGVGSYPGADLTAKIAQLATFGVSASRPGTVPDVANLANVRRLPLFLAAFLCLLAIGAVAHSLVTAARRRSHEMAVLRCLGLTPGQAAACVAWQATVIAAVGLLIGLPLGLIAGRALWREVASRIPIVAVTPTLPALVLVCIPGALLVVHALAIAPARAAARLRTATILHSE